MMEARIRASALTHLTLVEASDAVRNGEVSSVALTEAALEAFKAGDPTINASIALDTAEALETAEGLDRLRKAGRMLGSLHGVPLAHKDMYYRAGKPCTCGSRIRGAFRPTYTATAVKRLEDAGSITIGSLNMAEFAQNPTGHNAKPGRAVSEPCDRAPMTRGVLTPADLLGRFQMLSVECIRLERDDLLAGRSSFPMVSPINSNPRRNPNGIFLVRRGRNPLRPAA